MPPPNPDLQLRQECKTITQLGLTLALRWSYFCLILSNNFVLLPLDIRLTNSDNVRHTGKTSKNHRLKFGHRGRWISPKGRTDMILTETATATTIDDSAPAPFTCASVSIRETNRRQQILLLR